MSQPELLKTVIAALENSGIDYMLTGSLVSSMQGEPRSTHDIDIVISIEHTSVKKLIQAFSSPDFYLNEKSMHDAIKNQSTFNLINVKEGDKVDFWILTDESFDRSRFSRRLKEDVLGIRMQIPTPEDTILTKLRWAKLSGGSEKHFIDALRVYEVQFEKLDLEYLKNWVEKLNVNALWERLVTEAEAA